MRGKQLPVSRGSNDIRSSRQQGASGKENVDPSSTKKDPLLRFDPLLHDKDAPTPLDVSGKPGNVSSPRHQEETPSAPGTSLDLNISAGITSFKF